MAMHDKQGKQWSLAQQPYCDIHTLSIAREPARAQFYPYPTAQAAREGAWRASSRITCLSGTWRFRWFASPLCVTDDVILEQEDTAHGYADIQVPRNWQFAGYGNMLYTDEAYPFPVDPPFIPEENETGVYKRAFTWHKSEDDSRLFMRFEGVESAFTLYVNGQRVGYSQGSRMPSEFDITRYAKEGENALCVVVYQYCDGTYLEDQDMWWLGGIIRDVLLLERPQAYLADLSCLAAYDAQTGEGSLSVCATLSGDATARWSLFAPSGEAIISDMEAPSRDTAVVRVPGALAWNAEEPNLYQLVLTVYRDGEAVEATEQRIGFRSIQILDGTLLLNGKRIMLRGVNRHEFDPRNGRAVDDAMTERELLFIKRSGMNAVRTSHYPNCPALYDICDRIGLYVMDECDLETHGFEIEGDPTRLANDPQWTAAYIERAERMIARDKNHACVIMWSLGNESSFGKNFEAMYAYVKQVDASRPVHYESDTHCVACDVSSSMYTPVGTLHERDLNLSPKRPHILCEFAHAMGNGPGSLVEYIQTMEASSRIQGYFVWEYKDHGVFTQREDGKVCYRFGGEFGEDYSTGNFCIDGMLSAEGKPSAGFYEYKHLISPVQISALDIEKACVRVASRYDFKTLNVLSLHGEICRDGVCVQAFDTTVPPLAPGDAMDVPLGISAMAQDDALWTLTLVAKQGEMTVFADAGHALGDAHFVLKKANIVPQPSCGTMRVTEKPNGFHIASDRVSLMVSFVDGCIHDYCYDGTMRLEKGPSLNMFRAYLDNDRKLMGDWQAQHLHSMRTTIKEARAEQQADYTRITLSGTVAPNARNWRIPFEVVYDIDAQGAVVVSFCGDFVGDKGSSIPAELPKLGTKSRLPKALDQVTYQGMGPGECYCDSKQSARMGLYSAPADALMEPYECPQDHGNRTDVDFVTVTDAEGRGIAYASLVPRDMSIRSHEDVDLLHAAHACDVPEREYRMLHFDVRNSGLGSASCGPNHLAHHAMHARAFAFSYAISPIQPGDAAKQARRAQGLLLGKDNMHSGTI